MGLRPPHNQALHAQDDLLRATDLADFIDSDRADDQPERAETEHLQRLTYDELIARDKVNLHLIWPLETALAEFSELAASRPVDASDAAAGGPSS